MRVAIAFVLLCPSLVLAQPTAAQKKETVKWITGLEASNGGFYLAPQGPNIDAKPVPMLRATNGAVRALKYLGADVPNKEKHAAFVLKCYDPKTGGFAEPGGKPDVTITSIGVMAAAELGIPHEKYARAMDYLKENAKTFEEVRIGAAAVEAWGVKDCPFKLDAWFKIARKEGEGIKDLDTRQFASVFAIFVRLGENPFGPLDPRPKQEPEPKPNPTRFQLVPEWIVSAPPILFDVTEESFARAILSIGQRDDGGWGKKGEKASDIETTYRVMRALMLLKGKPEDAKKLREFIDAHRNKDGGYATKPGDKSSMSGAYYCVIVSKWLDEMEKK